MDYPKEGAIRVYKPDLSTFSVVKCTLATTVADIGGALFLSTSNGCERPLPPSTRPLELHFELLLRLGFSAGQLADVSDGDHSYYFRFLSGRQTNAVGGHVESASLRGSLLKEGHALIKKWEKRNCEIVGSRLKYFAPGESDAKGVIELIGARFEETPNKRDLSFMIQPASGGSKSFYFAAETKVDHKKWVTKIKSAISMNPNILDLTGQSITAVPADYHNVAGTTTLVNLTRNCFTSVASLAPFKSMVTVIISENELRAVPDGLFELGQLEELDLSRNLISEIPRDIARLTKLRTLAVHANRLSSLPDDLARLNLQTLVIAFNKFSELPAFVSSLKSLRSLIATGNLIYKLPDDIGSLSALERLEVGHNRLSSLPASIASLGSLTKLDARGNIFTAYPQAIARLAKLSTVDLTHCSIGGEAVVAMEGATAIALQENSISSFSFGGVVPQLITKINLAHNGLSELTDAVCDLPAIESLILKGNRLRTLPERIFNVPSLKWLFVGDNELEEIPQKVGKCRIQIMELQRNRIAQLPPRLFELAFMLRVLNVSENKLSDLPPLADPQINGIEELYLAKNNLGTDVLKRVLASPKLRVVAMNFNNIDAIPSSISHCEALEGLHLAGNKIQSVPEGIARLKKLVYLTLSGNHIVQVKALPTDAAFATVDLSCNRLREPPQCLLRCTGIENIDLSGNASLKVNWSSWDPRPLSKLRRLTLEGLAPGAVPEPPKELAGVVEHVSTAMKGRWCFGCAELLGRRPRMEDSRICRPGYGGNDGSALFAVFDGHSGPEVAQQLEKTYPQILADELRTYGGNAERALYTSFLQAHRSLGAISRRCGSTGVVMYSNLEGARTHTFVANVGDSELVVQRANGTTEVLSTKHKASTLSERERISMSGGFLGDEDRVCGVLATSRCLGDTYMHPFVTPIPAIAQTYLEAADRFAIMACDGIWDVLSYEEAAREVEAANGDPVLAARRLRDLAYALGSEDNITVMVISFSPFERSADPDIAPEALQETADAPSASQGSAPSGFMADYAFVRVLGEGSFGKVVLAKHNNKLVAVKILSRASATTSEVDVEKSMAKLQHPSLVCLRAHFESPRRIYLVMEYVGGGTFKVPDRPEDAFPEKRARFYGAQISLGLRFLHRHGIIYRDMSLHNLLLDEHGNVKIADFGLSSSGLSSKEFCGTPAFMAPEMVRKETYGKAVDWWGVGVVLYMMLVGRPPFFSDNIADLNAQITGRDPYFPHSLNKGAREFLKALLQRDPAARLGSTADEEDVIHHAFFKGVEWAKLENGTAAPPSKPDAKKIEPQNPADFEGWI